MRKLWVWAGVLMLAACTPPGPAQRVTRAPAETGPISYLPTLADYAAADPYSWAIQQQRGPDRTDRSAPRTEPPGCELPPFEQPDRVLATATAVETNAGPTGTGAEASVWLLRPDPATDPISQARDWAHRCHDHRIGYAGHPPDDPAAVSVLPGATVDGVDLLQVLLTDNRDHRYQAEGSRDTVLSLARAGGLVVAGRGHDDRGLAGRLVALTARRLDGHTPAVPTRTDVVRTDSLAGSSPVEAATLLPAAAELPDGWLVGQSLPLRQVRREDYPPGPADCRRVPFADLDGPYPDLNREFQVLAAATAARPGAVPGRVIRAFDRSVQHADTVWLGMERPGADVIAATRAWAADCAHWSRGDRPGWVEVLDVTAPAGVDDAVSVRLRRPGDRFVRTASVLRVRGLLVTTLPAVDRQVSPLLAATLADLRTAAPPGPHPPTRPPVPDLTAPPPGLLPLPAPSDAATVRLNRVYTGLRVDPAPYHRAGYRPGDAPVDYPDRLYFHSPTGAINCVFYQHYGDLNCDVPAGGYPRTPAPPPVSTWLDTVVRFGPAGIANGVAGQFTPAAAESRELPYGATLALHSDAPAAGIDCLMARAGLLCVNPATGIGLAVSRQELTPLAATAALRPS